MKEGAQKDYSFGQKNHWRRWQWNRIAHRLEADGVPVHRAVVVGLFGRDGHDVEVAEAKGFRRENLFSVERDEEAAKAARKIGVNVIRGDLQDVLASWQPDPGINVVLADLCAGLHVDAFRVLCSAIGSEGVPAGTVVAFNLLRGRDPLSKPSREASDAELLSKFRTRFPQNAFPPDGSVKKHRAWLLFGWHYSQLPEVLEQAYGLDLRDAGAPAVVRALIGGIDPEFASYRSGRLRFDSGVFRLVVKFQAHFKEIVAPRPSVKNRIAAAKAVRTMRGGGSFTFARRGPAADILGTLKFLAAADLVRSRYTEGASLRFTS